MNKGPMVALRRTDSSKFRSKFRRHTAELCIVAAIVALLATGAVIYLERSELALTPPLPPTAVVVGPAAPKPSVSKSELEAELEPPKARRVVLNRGGVLEPEEITVRTGYVVEFETAVPLMVMVQSEDGVAENDLRFLQLRDGSVYRIEGGNPRFGRPARSVSIPGKGPVRVRFEGLDVSPGRGVQPIRVPDLGLDPSRENRIILAAMKEAAVWVTFPPPPLPPRETKK